MRGAGIREGGDDKNFGLKKVKRTNMQPFKLILTLLSL
jgi:hypothetical protein